MPVSHTPQGLLSSPALTMVTFDLKQQLLCLLERQARARAWAEACAGGGGAHGAAAANPACSVPQPQAVPPAISIKSGVVDVRIALWLNFPDSELVR